jgi:two-component system chemotaxis response regulator CheB
VRSAATPPFSSAAEVFGPGVIAVVLTGSGHDATDGVQDVQAHGGLVVAEHPETARFPSMPLSANTTGDVARILPLDAIAPALRRLVGNPPGSVPSGSHPE